VLVAVVVNTYAYRRMALAKASHAIKMGKGKGTIPAIGWKETVLSVVGGLLLGSFHPLVETSQNGDAGLGPYAIAFMFAAGVFFSTFVYNLFFMNLTVQGQPVEMLEYLRGTLKQHALGVAGGVLWAVGAVASFVVASAPEAHLGPALTYGLGQGAAVVGALWGLLAWKEFRDGDAPARILMGAMAILFAGGVVLVSVARMYP
jgi:glucose uptake protein